MCSSFNRLSQRLKALQANTTSDQPSPILTFDKDDEDTLDFVAATANLRAAIFHIELNSKFEIKSKPLYPVLISQLFLTTLQEWLVTSSPLLLPPTL